MLENGLAEVRALLAGGVGDWRPGVDYPQQIVVGREGKKRILAAVERAVLVAKPFAEAVAYETRHLRYLEEQYEEMRTVGLPKERGKAKLEALEEFLRIVDQARNPWPDLDALQEQYQREADQREARGEEE